MGRERKEYKIEATTVRLHRDTLVKLEALRTHPRETPDDLINNSLKTSEGLTIKIAVLEAENTTLKSQLTSLRPS